MKRFVWPALACLLILAGVDSYGQVAMERVYADATDYSKNLFGNPAGVSNPGNAINGDINSYSKLDLPLLLGTHWQQLIFPSNDLPGAGTPVHIKLGTGSSILSLLSGFSIQAYNQGSAIGTPITITNLISLIEGQDQAEIVFIPTDASGSAVPYNAVRISGSSILDLTGSIFIYHAYFNKSIVNSTIACDDPVDLLYGSTGNLASGLNAIEDPLNAIDGDKTSAATIRANVSALNKTHLTTLYPTVAPAGDSVQLILKNPGGTLLDATLLANNFTIRTYLDNTDNGTLDLDPSFLRLRLLPGQSNVQVLTYPVNQPFNRIEISLGQGLVQALSILEVYEIKRLAIGPMVADVNGGIYTACEGNAIDLSISSPQMDYSYNWYDETGTLVAATEAYNPGSLAPGEHIFYVTATRPGCTTESGRTMIVVKVNESAVAADVDVEANAPFCVEDDVELVPSSETVPDPVFLWYYDSGKAQPISNGTVGSVTYQIAADGTLTIQGLAEGLYSYYVSVSNATTCENSAGDLKEVTVDVHAPPPEPIIELAPE